MRAHRDGGTIQGLARQFGVSNHTVRTILLGAGVELPHQAWKTEDEPRVRELREAGLSMAKIVRETGLSRTAVRMIVASFGSTRA